MIAESGRKDAIDGTATTMWSLKHTCKMFLTAMNLQKTVLKSAWLSFLVHLRPIWKRASNKKNSLIRWPILIAS